jgi:hypothetical protein
MVRFWSVVLGIGLILLWIAELGSPGFGGYVPSAGTATAARWITWLDLVGAFFAFVIAGVSYSHARRSARAAGPIALAIGLFVLWIVGLASNVVPWVSWWNFAFACAFLLMGIGSAVEEPARERGWSGGERYGGGYGGSPYQGFGPGSYDPSYDRWRGANPYVPERIVQGTRGYQRSDQRISEDVNDRLSISWDVDASDIEVKVSQGEVTLSGTVASRRERRVAEGIADSVAGVRDVHNELSLRALSPKEKPGRPRAA